MNHDKHQSAHNTQSTHKGKHYKHLAIMAVLSFICMYVLMYSMADSFSNVFPNINQFYMAGLMTMPMILIEIVVMSSMYINKKLNALIIGISVVLAMAFFLFIRQQTGVSDKQFVKGMIPHHAAAILMSEKSKTQDPEIKKLQQEIISSQQREIEQMKAILERLKKQ